MLTDPAITAAPQSRESSPAIHPAVYESALPGPQESTTGTEANYMALRNRIAGHVSRDDFRRKLYQPVLVLHHLSP